MFDQLTFLRVLVLIVTLEISNVFLGRVYRFRVNISKKDDKKYQRAYIKQMGYPGDILQNGLLYLGGGDCTASDKECYVPSTNTGI